MRVSLQWLKELVNAGGADLAPADLAERLSVAGFEVEDVTDLSLLAAGVVVGKVLQREPHPNAGKLSVCQVDAGQGDVLQIVCGAVNVRSGIHVPVALVGTTLPAVGLTIKEAELRGVPSRGMICSLSELGLAESSEGIAILEDLLPQVPPVGSAIGPCLGLDDAVLELAITANRPDGLSMLGIAREVAALVGGSTKVPSGVPVPAEPLNVAADQRAAMNEGGLFSLTELEGLTVGPSPVWLQHRLERAGIRAINNVVDITNLVMLETGQPLHAFDRDAVACHSQGRPNPDHIGLRQGREGESLLTLDAEPRQLNAAALVVTYCDVPIALAGVMGGQAEAVHGGTTSIWLEAAVFSAQAVRRSARHLGLRTEASSRFEKGLPPQATLAAADRAVALLQQVCGASPTRRWLHQGAFESVAPINLRRDALHNLLGPLGDGAGDKAGEDLEDASIVATLRAIGCQLESTEQGWAVRVPVQRAIDLQREVDLIEEVARLVGYDRFSAHLPDPLVPGGLEPRLIAERRLRRALCVAGLQELCSLSLVGAAPERLPLANPLLSDYGHLRHELHSDMLATARRNLQSGQESFWGFEIGAVFAPDGSARVELTALLCGSRSSERWSNNGKSRTLSYHQARGHLQQAFDAIGLQPEDRRLQNQPELHQPVLHPGRAAQLIIEGQPIGWFGQLHPAQAEQADLPQASYLLTVQIDPLLTAATRSNRWHVPFKPFSTQPASERDLAVLVPRELAAADLLQAIYKAGRPLLEHAELIDRYEGDPVPEGLCSQAFRLRYRDPVRTLVDHEVEQVHSAIIAGVQKRFKAQLRE